MREGITGCDSIGQSVPSVILGSGVGSGLRSEVGLGLESGLGSWLGSEVGYTLTNDTQVKEQLHTDQGLGLEY